MAMQHQYEDDQTSGLIINIVPELSKRIRKAAAQSNLSEQEYVERVLEQVVPPEINSEQGSRRLSRAAVDKLLQTREAIKRAHPGQVFEDSSELIYQMHEERAQELEEKLACAAA